MKNVSARIASLVLLFCCGCAATRFDVQVSGLAAADAPLASEVALVPARPNVDSLEWSEFSEYLEHALSQEGFRPTSSQEAAETVVFVDYGISGPEQYEYTSQEPVFGQVGSSTTYQTTYNAYGGYGLQSTTTPEIGITHYRSQTNVGTRFHRFLDLTAFQRQADGTLSEEPLWQTRMRSSGTSGDLRRVFPVLVAAAQPYIGRSTGQTLTVTLKEKDRRVQDVIAKR